jgi:VanZ family protein
MRRLALWVPPIAYMALIYYLSSQSNPLPMLTTHVWDKAIHGTEYGVLGLLWCRAWRGEGWSWAAAGALAFIATAAYGASDEWHQASVAMRTSDIHDWVADLVGGVLGPATYRLASQVERRARGHAAP